MPRICAIGSTIARGDRVAVLAHNTTDTLEVQFACGRLGAVFLPLNTRLTVPELQFIVADAAPKLMIHDADLAETARTVARLCDVAAALALGAGGAYEAAIAAARPLDNCEDVTLDDISTIMYTSGTTGQPKGAIITHGMTFWNCVNLGGPAYITPSSVLLTVLPLFHTGGLNCYTNPVLHAGGTVLIMRAFDPGLALQLISDPAQGINVFFGVPSIYQFMAQHPLFETADFSRLIIGGVGGAPMPVPLLNVWEMRGVALQQGYGMTETVAGGARRSTARTPCARPALPASRCCIPRCGSFGPTAATPPSASSANSGSRDRTSRPATGTGRMPTGRPSPTAGCIPATPRASTRTVSTTSSIAGRTCTFPAARTSIRPRSRTCCTRSQRVAEAAVIGVPDPQWGEVGMAIVAVKPGHSLTEAAIHTHCAANLARFKCPRLIRFVDALPRNATGKIHKPTLRKNFARLPTATDLARGCRLVTVARA